MTNAIVRHCLLVCLLALFWGWGGAARAQTCNFSAPDMLFGAVDVLGTGARDSSTNINISCSGTLGLLSSFRVTIHLGDGLGGTAAGGPRRMTGAQSPPLNYELYSNAGRTTVWGSSFGTHGGTSVVVSQANLLELLSGRAVSVPVYGRVFGGQSNVRPGNYTSAFSRDPTDVRIEYRTCNLLGLLCTDRVGTLSFTARASVGANCTVVADDLLFGTHGVLNSAVDASAGMRVRCTTGTSYNVGIGYGLAGTSVTTRRMRNGLGQSVAYQLFRNSAHTQIWGLAADGSGLIGAGTGGTQNHPVFGRVPAQATPPPGQYTDVVTVTVTY